MKKILNDMTWEEMKALYEKNSWLRDQITEEAQAIEADMRDDIVWWLAKKPSCIDGYEFGGYADYIRINDAHFDEFVDLAEEMFNDCAIHYAWHNLPSEYSIDNASTFFCTAHRLAQECDEYLRNGYCTTDPDDEFYDRDYAEAHEKLIDFVSAISKEMIDECHSECDPMDALESWWDEHGSEYATDGRYIYEVAIRQYA